MKSDAQLTLSAIFGVGGLLAGFAQNKIWLYCARAVSGIGGGGINSLSMIIVSDVVPIRERGKYLTLLGVGIAAGSGTLSNDCICVALLILSSYRTFPWGDPGSRGELEMGVLDDGAQYVKWLVES